MAIHKRTRLTPLQRQEIYDAYYRGNRKVSDLAQEYHVSRPTVYKILRRGRLKDFSIHKSTNKRYRPLKYGMRRLAKIERWVEEGPSGRPKGITKAVRVRCSTSIPGGFPFWRGNPGPGPGNTSLWP